MAVNPQTNEPVLQILYRQGADNEADALSRLPDLHYALTEYENRLVEADLEQMQDYLSAMSALQIDSKFIKKIKAAYITDVAYSHGRTPNGGFATRRD